MSIMAATSPARTATEPSPPPVVAPIWIDSTTKGLLKRVSDDATLLAAVLFNTPTVGCHHVQKHVQSRAPKVIEEARLLGRRMHESYEGLQKDVTFGADFAAAMVSSRSNIQNIALLSKQALENHRGAQREAAVEALEKSGSFAAAPLPAAAAPEAVVDMVDTTAPPSTVISGAHTADVADVADVPHATTSSPLHTDDAVVPEDEPRETTTEAGNVAVSEEEDVNELPTTDSPAGADDVGAAAETRNHDGDDSSHDEVEQEETDAAKDAESA
ncbi:Hypothetical protein, putative [Bodo saltans]|uniref:Uncharacterized protein n=1 Tax=Bodo saltans TaxID=75058 RepID=A0A0S4J824_BODSA|nr:Hypothetical protein, putative [Bodo saltans]|eukprot:CUG87546.1 Hypothetical protein, putative [Bodo saltans]